jgi:hypothetical protein
MMSWSYEWTNDVGPDDEYYVEFYEIKDDKGSVIGTIEEKSDAQLVAAAPDLLESVRELCEAMESAIKAGDWKVDGACDPELALRRAELAIKKAIDKGCQQP